MTLAATSTSFLTNLSTDLEKIFEYSDDWNVVIIVGSDVGSIKSFKAHSVILRARCPYFHTALSCDWAKKQKAPTIDEGRETFILNLPNTRADVFETVLRYIYTGTITLSSSTPLLFLLRTADELALDELFAHVQRHIINSPSWLQENLFKVLDIAFTLPTAKKLKEHCLSLISRSPREFFNSQEFLEVKIEILTSVLEQEELNIREDEILKRVIDWGVANTVLSSSSFSEGGDNMSETRRLTTEQDFEEVKSTLSSVIPLIRFSEIPKREIFDTKENDKSNTPPYVKFLPANLLNELLNYYFTKNNRSQITFEMILPPRSKLSSNIITTYHTNFITRWIYYNDSDSSSSLPNMVPPYRFKLIYRATREQFSSQPLLAQRLDFPVTIVARIRGTREIVGGYAPTMSSERVDKYVSARDSFIFSFSPDSGIDPNGNIPMSTDDPMETDSKEHCPREGAYTLSRVLPKYWDRAIPDISCGYCCFGKSDLRIGGVLDPRSGFCHKGSYERKIREIDGAFSLDEYEVFRVIRM